MKSISCKCVAACEKNPYSHSDALAVTHSQKMQYHKNVTGFFFFTPSFSILWHLNIRSLPPFASQLNRTGSGEI